MSSLQYIIIGKILLFALVLGFLEVSNTIQSSDKMTILLPLREMYLPK